MNEEVTTQKKRLKNYAIVEGVVRENNLKIGVNSKGSRYIGGDIIVSVSRTNAQKVRVYVYEKRYDGSPNPNFGNLLTILPDKVVSIAGYLTSIGADETQSIDNLDQVVWETASKQATKVWLSGSLEEFVSVYVDEHGQERERSSFSISATNGGIKEVRPNRPFSPRVVVDIDGYIMRKFRETKRNEDGENEETGRLGLDLIYIDYKGVAHKFRLYAPHEEINIKTQGGDSYPFYIDEIVDDNYDEGQTAKFTVSVLNLVEQKTVMSTSGSGWGTFSEPTIRTTFVHDIIITGGRSTSGIDPDSPDAIAKADVTAALTRRLEVGRENEARYQNKKNAAPAVAPGSGAAWMAEPQADGAKLGSDFSLDATGGDGFPF